MPELSPSQRLLAQIEFVNALSVRFLRRTAHVVWGAGFRNPDKIPDDDPYWAKVQSSWRNRLGCWFADEEQRQCFRLYKRLYKRQQKRTAKEMKSPERTGKWGRNTIQTSRKRPQYKPQKERT